MNGLLVFIEMKQKYFFFLKKKSKWPTQKNDQKPHFLAPPILNIFSKISWIGPWVSRID